MSELTRVLLEGLEKQHQEIRNYTDYNQEGYDNEQLSESLRQSYRKEMNISVQKSLMMTQIRADIEVLSRYLGDAK